MVPAGAWPGGRVKGMTEQLAVAVLGANGRMGIEAVKAVEAAEDMKLVAALGRGDSLEKLLDAGAQYVVDLTVPDVTETNVRFAVEHGIHAVVGTTGWNADRLDSLRALLEGHPESGVLIAPNFALGSVLASAFAAKASKYFESVEIIELHHPNKVDAPSGTAVRTAQLIAEARQEAGVPASPDATETMLDGARGCDVEGVRVHSVRLRGLVAHQEVLFGGPGEQLTLRHDSFDRASFMPGVLLGLRQVAANPGLTVGLDGYLDLGL
jgi:4-hydroxy-tetrahydrodipicolinate reductase